jgi:hypothetical protein
MKTIFGFIALFVGVSAQADVACNSLSQFVGDYKLVSQTCQGPWGATLNVKPFENTYNGQITDTGYMLTSGGIGIGPSTTANAVDKCEVSGNSVSVLTGYYDRSSLPQDWYYNFSGSTVSFQANGCQALFTK